MYTLLITHRPDFKRGFMKIQESLDLYESGGDDFY